MEASAEGARKPLLKPMTEARLWLAVIFASFMVVIFFAVMQDWRVAIPIAAALGGLMLAGLGGTRVCLPLYYITTFGNQFVIPGVPVSINQGLAALTLLAFLLDLLKFRPRWNVSVAFLAFLLFQVVYLANTLLMRPEDGDFPIQPPFYILLTLIIMLFFWEEKWLRMLTLAFSLLCLVMTVPPGLFELVTGLDIMKASYGGHHGRINGFAVNAIVYAFAAIWCLPLMAVQFLEARTAYWKTFWIVGILATVGLVFMTLNRQSPVILGAVMVVFVMFCRSRWKWPLMACVVGVGIALAPVFAVKAANRLSARSSFTTDFSLAVRRDKVIIATEMIKAHPLFGIGHGHFRYFWWDYRPPGKTFLIQFSLEQEMYVDMGYVQIVTEYGFVGLALFLLSIGSAFLLWLRHYRIALRLKEPWYVNMLAAIAAMFAQLLISLMIQDTWITTHTFMLFGLLFAMCVCVGEAWRRQCAATRESAA